MIHLSIERYIHWIHNRTGTDISTCPDKCILKEGLSGKDILVCACPIGQADIDHHTFFIFLSKWHKYQEMC